MGRVTVAFVGLTTARKPFEVENSTQHNAACVAVAGWMDFHCEVHPFLHFNDIATVCTIHLCKTAHLGLFAQSGRQPKGRLRPRILQRPMKTWNDAVRLPLEYIEGRSPHGRTGETGVRLRGVEEDGEEKINERKNIR